MGLIIVKEDNDQLCWNASTQSWETDDYDTFKDQTDTDLPPGGRWEVVPWRARN